MESEPEDISRDFAVVDSEEVRYVHDGHRFWLHNDAGQWISMTEASFRRELRGLGKRTKARETETLSEIDRICNDVEKNFRVSWVGALAGWWSGYCTMGGEKVLITEDPRLIVPVRPPDDAPRLEAPDAFGDSRGWPVWGRVLRGMLSCPIELDAQLWWYFTYLRHTMACLYERRWDNGMALALAGEINCGKSLLLEVHRVLFGGKQGKPYKWMSGQETFNGDLLKTILLAIDDEVSDTSPKSRSLLSDHAKMITSASFQRIRAMQNEGLTLQPLWRLMICVNDTPDKMMILPVMEDDNRDKFGLLRAYAKPMPMPSETTPEKQLFWRTIESELPHFLWWLLNEFELKREWQGRFGARAYHHPYIVDSLFQLSKEMQFWEYLKRTIFAGPWIDRQDPHSGEALGKWEWKGTCGELYNFLMDTKTDQRPTLSAHEALSVPKPVWIGQRLTHLRTVYPDCVIAHVTAKARYWHLKPPSEANSDGGDSV